MGSMRGGDADLAAQITRLVEKSPITADDIAGGRARGHRRAATSWSSRTSRPARRTRSSCSDRPAYDEQMRGRPRPGRRSATHERPDRADVRDEDAFDVAAMSAWLREHGDDVPAGVPAVRQFPGGASNLTYLLATTTAS